MRILYARRTWMTLALVSLLAVVAGGTGWANGFPTYAPDWWDNPEPNSTNLRACWYEWDELWIDGRGMTPDDFSMDFTHHPSWNQWEWTHEALDSDNVSADGILIPRATSDWEVDLVLGNRNLREHKLWYVEFGITEVDEDQDYGNSISKLFDLNRWSITTESYMDLGGGNLLTVPVVEEVAPEIRWSDDGTMMVWNATYRMEPQPDMEKVTWHFFTNGAVPPSINEDLHMRYLNTGTMCTPEPVTVVLLALGLPLGILARRRKD